MVLVGTRMEDLTLFEIFVCGLSGSFVGGYVADNHAFPADMVLFIGTGVLATLGFMFAIFVTKNSGGWFR